ncbi:MAG: molybdopterin-dependent oxidoreductase, partial [Sphingomonadales bacterium]|nr:molybdopterin-dependent oxidoreductase [Sphingomonadales bacterium]
SARALLAMAAARRWGVGWQDCTVEDGEVRHGGRALGLGELAGDAAQETPPDPPVLRAAPVADAADAATPRFPRLDLAGKASGACRFAGDVRLPGMVYAAIRHGPIGDARLGRFDTARAHGIPGFLRVVAGERWLAAVASDWWAAERALTAIAPRFHVTAPASSERFDTALAAALAERPGWFSRTATIAAAGDAGAALAGDVTLRQRYAAGPALHLSIETASATARLRPSGPWGETLELWIASQAPEAARRAAAAAAGVALDDVVLYPMPAGGSFDARLESAHAAEVAAIARAVGRPVQLTWSRWQEQLAVPVRPPVVADIAARTDSAGRITAWHMRAALPAAAREFGARLFGGKDAAAALSASDGAGDPLALEGAVPPYAIADYVIEHVPVRSGLPSGRLRGNAHGYTAFFTECFVDELAAQLHREPLAFRMAMLGNDPRLAQCLQRVSALADWNGGGDGSGQGIACHRMGSVSAGGCIAAVAIARRGDNGLKVDRISAVADIGRVVDADIARQQIEGGLVFGIGLALGSSTGYVLGLPAIGRLAGLGLPSLADCPRIEVELMTSDAPAFDPGELGVAVAAPAIANALASATGERFRKLPLGADE